MTPEPTTPPPRSRWRRWRISRWLLIAVLAVLGYCAWREYDFRAAIKEAEALGWTWEYDDPIDAIRKDWKAAFRKATWTDGKRFLAIPEAAEFERNPRLVRRLAPKTLSMLVGPELKDLSALKGLRSLQTLSLFGCSGLTNVDGLKELPALQGLGLNGCSVLTNVDGLKGLPALQELSLFGCTELTNVDALKGLTALQKLWLSGCTRLTNVDALKGLPALQTLWFTGCTNLSMEAVAALKAALPNTKIISSSNP